MNTNCEGFPGRNQCVVDPVCDTDTSPLEKSQHMFNPLESLRVVSLRFKQSLMLSAVICLVPNTGTADIINFSSTTWNHGSGPQQGWQGPVTLDAPTFSGTTTLDDGTELTLTVSDHGSVTHFGDASDHLQTISTGTTDALNINQNSANSKNLNGVIENYVRIDVELSRSRWLYALWHDVDTGHSWDLNNDGQPDNRDWTDIMHAESHNGNFRDIGEGKEATYDIGANLELITRDGLNSVVASPGTTNIDHQNLAGSQFMTDNSIWTSFDTPAKYYSFYYWNDNPLANYGDIQRVLLGGLAVNDSPYPAFNQFGAPTSVPEPTTCMLSLLAASVGVCLRLRKRTLATT